MSGGGAGKGWYVNNSPTETGILYIFSSTCLVQYKKQ